MLLGRNSKSCVGSALANCSTAASSARDIRRNSISPASVWARRDAWVRRFAASLFFLVLVQFGVGLLNAALLAPVWLQIVHLLLADLLWLALVLLSASGLVQTEAVRGGSPTVREGVLVS